MSGILHPHLMKIFGTMRAQSKEAVTLHDYADGNARAEGPDDAEYCILS